MIEPPKRDRAPVIYKTMPVHNDLRPALLLDGVCTTDMGNVFEKGVKGRLTGCTRLGDEMDSPLGLRRGVACER
jgi:hypothetical protein